MFNLANRDRGKDRRRSTWRLADECVTGEESTNDINMDISDASIISTANTAYSLPVTSRNRSVLQNSRGGLGDFFKNALNEKTDTILQLNYGIKATQIEMMDSVTELTHYFREIEIKLLENRKEFDVKFETLEQKFSHNFENLEKKISTNFENLEQMISKMKAIPVATAVESKVSKSQRNKNKKQRRKAVLGEKTQGDITMKKFPKSDKAKQLICQSIKSNYHFRACTDEELGVLADAFDVAKFANSDVISAQGEKLEYFYIIEEGTVDSFIDGEYIRSVRSLETFGEESLVLGCLNTSTFRARGDCKLWAIDTKDFRNITAHYRRKRLELKTGVLRNVKFGKQKLGDILDASDIDSLALATSSEIFKKGDYIIKEGDKGDVFYMIEEGTVNIYKETLGDKILVSLHNGNFFGEKALFSNDVRSASCVAGGDVKCLIIVRDDFVRLFGDLQELLDKAQRMVDESFLKKDGDKKESLRKIVEVRPKANLDIKHDQFEINKELGEGSFSKVKLVTFKDKKHNPFPKTESFALKYSSKAVLAENKLMDHVKNEANILREIDHPFVIRYFHDFEDEKTIYFLLEAVLGDELYNVLYDEITFSEQWSLFYTASVVLAFGEIHSKKIAYRDLKPENLMLDRDGYVKIVDFGFAKKVDKGKTWTLCGTPDYFAPELIQNEGHDWGVDYWALGVLIFEMMTGVPPFSGDTELAIYKNILSAYINYPQAMNPDLIDLITCLCTIDQSKRLGRTKGGTDGVKEHKWFSGFPWKSLYKKQVKAPYAPKLKTGDDYNVHIRNSTARKLSGKSSPSPSIIKERRSITQNLDNDNSKLEKDENEPKNKPRQSVVRFSADLEKNSEDEKHTLHKVNDESSPGASIPSDISLKPQAAATIMEEIESCAKDENVGKPAIRNSIRDRKKSYMFGSNRYKQQLEEFMNQQRRHSQPKDFKENVNSITEELNGIREKNDAHASTPIHSERHLLKELKKMPERSQDVSHNSFDQFFLLSVLPQSFNSALIDSNLGCGYLDPFYCKSVEILDQYPIESSKSSMTFEEISLSCFSSGVKCRLIPRSALGGAKRIGWAGKNADDYQMHTFTDESGTEKCGLSIIIREEVSNVCLDSFMDLRLKRKAAVTIRNFYKNFVKKKSTRGSKKGSKKGVGNSFANSIRRLSDPLSDRLDDSRSGKRRSSTTIVETKKSDNVLSFHKSSVRNKAKESYKNMLRNERLGEICIVEKCFVFVDTKADEQSLLLCALKHLADFERMDSSCSEEDMKEMDGSARRKKSVANALSKAKTAILGRNSDYLKRNRHNMLKTIQTKFCLSQEQARVHYPKGEMEHIRKKLPTFNIDPLQENLPSISLPLPLPDMSGEWGVAVLLLRVKSAGLLVLLNLLLLERSVLVIGTNRAEVTSCTCALLDMLKPYQWASAFMPLIPSNMLDFVSSPVPFIAGILGEKKASLKYIEKDYRVLDAVEDGMSILNIESGIITVTSENGIEDIVKNSHGAIHQRLKCYQKRLEDLVKTGGSALLSFNRFFEQGATPQESLTIQSLKRAICEHFTNVFKSLSEDPEEWKKYGEFDSETNAFEYFPYRLVTPLQTQLHFQQMLAHTQLFIGFVDKIKNSYLYPNKDAALFIADWLYFKWRILRKRDTAEFLNTYDSINWRGRNSMVKRFSDATDDDTDTFMGWDGN